jgi:hypothetical protein
MRFPTLRAGLRQSGKGLFFTLTQAYGFAFARLSLG